MDVDTYKKKSSKTTTINLLINKSSKTKEQAEVLNAQAEGKTGARKVCDRHCKKFCVRLKEETPGHKLWQLTANLQFFVPNLIDSNRRQFVSA
jgi:hypothetical protein